MKYLCIKKLQVGGKAYSPGDIIPGSVFVGGRADKLESYGYIKKVAEETPEEIPEEPESIQEESESIPEEPESTTLETHESDSENKPNETATKKTTQSSAKSKKNATSNGTE